MRAVEDLPQKTKGESQAKSTSQRSISIHKGKTQKKKENEIRQKKFDGKGFIDNKQKWLITGSLHDPAELTSDEERRQFEFGPREEDNEYNDEGNP